MTIRRSSRPSRGPRRKLVWARQGQSPSTTLAFGTAVLIPLLTGFQLAYGADPIGATVRRIRGNISMRTGSASFSLQATVGIGVFPQASTSASVSPAGSPHLDWMFYRQFFVEPVVTGEFGQVMMYDIDVRSQRKMEELGEDLIMVIQNTHPSSNLAYAYHTSVLLALP